MLYAVRARFKEGVQARAIALGEEFSVHLQQPVLRIHLGGPLQDETGARVGVLIIVEAPDLAAARGLVDSSPYTRAGLYADIQIDRFQAEAGRI